MGDHVPVIPSGTNGLHKLNISEPRTVLSSDQPPNACKPKNVTNIDPKIKPLTLGKKKKKILGLIPGSKIIERVINSIFFEIDSSNKILWLYKP